MLSSFSLVREKRRLRVFEKRVLRRIFEPKKEVTGERRKIHIVDHMVRHPRCAFINYNWINQLSNTTIWWLDICCLLHRYQLHVSALMAIFRLID